MSPQIDFPSPFLKANKDVKSGDIIKFLDAGEQDENGQWIFLVLIEKTKTQKKFSLNKTNWKAISKVYGTNSDEWVGKEFEVRIVEAPNPQMGGEEVPAIRLRVPNRTDEGEVEIE